MGGTFFRFLLVGAVNTLIGYGFIIGLQFKAGLSATVANAAGYAIGAVVSYLLNRQFTFKSQRQHRSGIPAFAVAAGISYALNLVTLNLMLTIPDMHAAVAQAVAVGTYTLTFYFVSKRLVFN